MPPAASDDPPTPNRPSLDADTVEYIVISLPDLASSMTVAEALKSLAESSKIRILDLVGVVTDVHGRYVAAEPELVSALVTLADVDGEVGGILSDDDIAIACRALRSGSSALILVAEDLWAQELAEAARTAGGQVVGGERIPRQRLAQAARAREARRSERGE